MALYDGVVSGECLKLVLGRDEGQPRELSDIASHDDIVALRCIEPRPDSRPPESELREVWEGVLDGLDAVLQLGCIATELLA